MVRDKLVPLMLIPAMLVGQNGQLSEAARKLLRKPRSDYAQLTWSDGRKEDGSIMWVTDQFVTFVTGPNPFVCENVELSKIATVNWHHASGNHSASRLGGEVFVGAVLAPFFVGHAVADPFRRMSPPLKPLSGDWESIRPSRGGFKSSIAFKGSTVRHLEFIVRQGRYSVEGDRLHLIFDGVPETVIPFHFNCMELILGSPAGRFRQRSVRRHVTAPIVGEWQGSSSILDFKGNGSFEERKEEVRSGIFEKNAAGVRIRWANGEEWSAQVKHHHLVFRVGGETIEYRYIPPAFAVDL